MNELIKDLLNKIESYNLKQEYIRENYSNIDMMSNYNQIKVIKEDRDSKRKELEVLKNDIMDQLKMYCEFIFMALDKEDNDTIDCYKVGKYFIVAEGNYIKNITNNLNRYQSIRNKEGKVIKKYI